MSKKNTKTIRVGIIGAGNIAKLHLDVIKANDALEAVGITSRTRSKAELLAKTYDIAVCANNIESLVDQAKPDALMVLVSADQMSCVVPKVIPYKLPLFIEKPAGLSPEENKKLADLAKQASVKTMVGFNRRHYSIFRKGLKIIKEHGPLMGVLVEGHERMWLRADKLAENVRAQWIFSNSIHTIDLLRFFGGEPSKIASIAHRYIEPRGDQFAAVMELGSGAIGQYVAHWYSPGGWRVVLYGQGVTVEFKPLESGRFIDKEFKVHEITPDEVDLKFKPGFYAQMDVFAKFARGEDPVAGVQDLEGAYRTMLLAEKISGDLIDKEQAKRNC